MKLRKLLFTSIAFLTPIGVSLNISTSCSRSNLPKVKKAVTKNTHIYDAVADESGNIIYFDSDKSIKITHFNDSSIGYVCVDAYVQKCDLYRITSESSNNQTIISNEHRNAKCIIDFNQQTITFDDYDAFRDMDISDTSPLAEGSSGIEKYLGTMAIASNYTKGNSITIDLKKYNIKAYFYDGKGYLPYELVRNILNIQYYTFGEYNGNGIYETLYGNEQAIADAQKQLRNEATIYDNEHMEYSYNLLAMTLDLRFGLKERKSRSSKDSTIKYMTNGAYAMLQPYHDRLVSTNDDVSNTALMDLFKNELDDGGHTRYSCLNIFSTKPYAEKYDYGNETKYTFDVMDKLQNARGSLSPTEFWRNYWTSKSKTTSEIENWLSKHNHDAYYTEYERTGKPTIAYLTFDSFTPESILTYSSEESRKNRELPSENDSPAFDDVNFYCEDTLRLTMHANKMIQKNKQSKNIKYLVVDLSQNTGGAVYAEHFLASWLCNGITEKIYNPITNGYCEYTIHTDVNGDGVVNENDYLPNGISVYVITSSSTFSCGNMLACNIQDSIQNATIIGTKSGGGSCFVDQNLYSGTCSGLRFSSTYHMLRKSSTIENKISNDSGCDVQYEIDEINNPDAFYDRDEINRKIWEAS